MSNSLLRSTLLGEKISKICLSLYRRRINLYGSAEMFDRFGKLAALS
jgi:hypothetical protein